jgi:hypothetical protein
MTQVVSFANARHGPEGGVLARRYKPFPAWGRLLPQRRQQIRHRLALAALNCPHDSPPVAGLGRTATAGRTHLGLLGEGLGPRELFRLLGGADVGQT